ncbi:MAG: cell division protein FtsZ [Candidatus Sumerlaeia bacterium]|nr:cell division protein FtsZ [Candidatus Sumerlaeia bacterium]
MSPFEIEQETRPPARIKVIGIGGGGCNAVDGMIASGLANVEFHVLNTDAQALTRTQCPHRLQIGAEVTGGLGCGGDPLMGEKAATASKEAIQKILEGTDMVFLAAGLGGGTGTGATPVIAQMAKEKGILTVAIVTRPFQFEGPQRMQKALQGLEKLRQYVDTLIVVSNDRLLEVVGTKATLLEAFALANSVLAQGVQSISDLISRPGLINLDFADVRAIMGERGGAVMGVGVGKGENRAEEAVKKACSSPLLDKIQINGATGVLLCINGPNDLRLSEINAATTMVYKAADPNANIIFGVVVDEDLSDEVRVTIIATGFTEDMRQAAQKKPDDEQLKSATSGMPLDSKLKAIFAGRSEKPTPTEPPPVPPSMPGPARPATPLPTEHPTGGTGPIPRPRPAAEQPPESSSSPLPPPRFPDIPRRNPAGPSAWTGGESRFWSNEGSTGAASAATGREDLDTEESDSMSQYYPPEDSTAENPDFGRISLDARREITGDEAPQSRYGDSGADSDLETPTYLRKRRDLSP